MIQDTEAKTILLVDDDPLVKETTATKLEDDGYRVMTALTEDEAVEISRTDAGIDLILMDIDLGSGMDGAQAAEIILQERDAPVVFLSSYTDEETAAKTENITSYGYVVKSAGDAVLRASVKMAFRLHEAHAQIREDEQHYALLFETITEGVVYQATDGSIISANPAAERILWLSFDQMRGKTSMDPRWRMIRDDGVEVAHTDHPAMIALRTGQTVGPVLRGVFHPEKNRYVWLRITAVPLFDAGRETPTRAYATFEDISDERDLRNRYKELVNRLPGIVYTYSTSRGGIYRSNQVQQILGYGQEELEADPFLWSRSIHPDDRPTVEEMVTGPREDSEESVEYRVQASDGSWIVFHDRILNKTFDGNETIIDGFATDVTEQKRAEDQIRRLADEKQMLVQEIQHRIKNNINTMTSLLSMQIQALEDRSAVAALQDTKHRLNSLGVLYDHLYQSGARGEGSLRGYVSDLVSSEVELFPHSQHVQIHMDLEDCLCTAKVLSSLGLIVNELLTNAMKYAFRDHQNPKLTITGIRRDDDYVLSIMDNGPGMSESHSKQSSSGFGLMMINALTEQLQGTIQFENAGGVRVVLKFPVADSRCCRDG